MIDKSILDLQQNVTLQDIYKREQLQLLNEADKVLGTPKIRPEHSGCEYLF